MHFVTTFALQFNDVDARNSLIGDWEKEFIQTAPGRFRSEVVGRIGAGSLLMGEEFHGATRLMSSAGRDSGYLIWLEGAALRINGSDGWHQQIVTVAAGAELEAATPTGARAVRLSFLGATAERFQAELQHHSPMLRARLGSGLQRPQVAVETRTRFSRLLGELELDIARGSMADRSPACMAVIDDSLCSAALDVLLEGRLGPVHGAAGGHARRQLALRAETLLRSASDAPLTVGELCLRLGCSERVLELSFRAQFGVCVRKFMIALRLHRAHRALSDADALATVTSAATDQGFWHLGRFSNYYRQAFGVPPSATLRLRTRGAPPPARATSPWVFAMDKLGQPRQFGRP